MTCKEAATDVYRMELGSESTTGIVADSETLLTNQLVELCVSC